VNQNLKALLLLFGGCGLAQGVYLVAPPNLQTLVLFVGITPSSRCRSTSSRLSGQSPWTRGVHGGGGLCVGVRRRLSPPSGARRRGERRRRWLFRSSWGLAGALMGFLVGLPALRLRGDLLAIATLGFGEIIRVVFLNIQSVGGARGMIGIPQTTTAALTFGLLALRCWASTDSSAPRMAPCSRCGG
jgi:hypothetical protein